MKFPFIWAHPEVFNSELLRFKVWHSCCRLLFVSGSVKLLFTKNTDLFGNEMLELITNFLLCFYVDVYLNGYFWMYSWHLNLLLKPVFICDRDFSRNWNCARNIFFLNQLNRKICFVVCNNTCCIKTQGSFWEVFCTDLKTKWRGASKIQVWLRCRFLKEMEMPTAICGFHFKNKTWRSRLCSNWHPKLLLAMLIWFCNHSTIRGQKLKSYTPMNWGSSWENNSL